MLSSLDKENWELKTIEEIAQVKSGREITRVQLGTGNYPAIKCGDINSRLPMQFTECISLVDFDSIKNKRFFEYGDILISKISNKIETIGKAVVYLNESQKGLMGEGVMALKHNQNPKYLAYALSSEFCREQIEKLLTKSIVLSLNIDKLKKIKVPIPPRHVQEKIANLFDKLFSIETDLKGFEVQRQYYLDKIISY